MFQQLWLFSFYDMNRGLIPSSVKDFCVRFVTARTYVAYLCTSLVIKPSSQKKRNFTVINTTMLSLIIQWLCFQIPWREHDPVTNFNMDWIPPLSLQLYTRLAVTSVLIEFPRKSICYASKVGRQFSPQYRDGLTGGPLLLSISRAGYSEISCNLGSTF